MSAWKHRILLTTVLTEEAAQTMKYDKDGNLFGEISGSSEETSTYSGAIRN